MNLLVVDWDYFFPVPHHDLQEWLLFYDWTHSEGMSPTMQEWMWQDRAAMFFNEKGHLPTVDNDYLRFWDRVKLDPTAALTFANSNVHAISDQYGHLWMPGLVEQVWLFDAHHDSGYGKLKKPKGDDFDLADVFPNGQATCEDWLAYFTLTGSETHVRYPRWHKKWEQVDRKPDIKPTSRMRDIAKNKTDKQLEHVEFGHVFVCRSDAWVPPWCDHDFEVFIARAGFEETTCLDEESQRPRPFDLAAVKKFADERKEAITRLNIALERGEITPAVLDNDA